MIGEVEINEKKKTTTIKNGAVIMPVGEGKMAIVPWLPHAEKNEVEVENEKIAFSFEPIKDIVNQYSTQFGNGLVIPEAPVANALSMGEDSGLENFKIG